MTIKDDLTGNFKDLLDWHQERSILETTELVCDIMAKHEVSRVELADKVEKSKGFISQLLNGTANMTIRTISDMCVALGYEFHPSVTPLVPKEAKTVYLDSLQLKWVDTTTAVPQASQYASTKIAGSFTAP